MAKISDVFGRFEAFCIAVVVFVIGYVEMAAADDMATYASAQIFYSAGSTGLQILQQVFIADTTSLANRAIFSVIPGLPFLATVWIGPSLAQTILSRTTWRWNYGIWSIVLPTTFAPLAISLYFHRKRSKSVQVPTIPYSEGQEKKSIYQFLRNLWFDLDLFGLVLLTAGISLVLVPLTLAPRAAGGWANQSMVAMLVVGAISLSIFPFWERSKAFAPHALFPPQLFANRTTLAGTALAFFYFSMFIFPNQTARFDSLKVAFYLSIYPYYYSYLLVVEDLDITTAGRITQTFSFSSAITAFIISWLIKWTGNYKYFVIFGVCIYTLGMGLMLHYRQPDTSLAALIGCQITIGIGGGLVLAPAQLGVQASAERGQVAAVTAVFLTVLEIGGAVGNAVSGAIWSSYIPKQLTLYLPVDRQDQVALIYDSVTYASEHFAQGTVERNAINHAYQDTMSVLLVIAICMAVPCIFLSLCMENYKLQEMDQRQPGPVTGEEYGTTATDNTPSSMCDTPRETHVCT